MKYVYLLILLLYGCASVQVLDGGIKDVTPPIVLKVIPDSASTNITTSIFTFTFDEYIKTNKLNDLLIISPSQRLNPSVTIKGKKVTIKLLDSLLDNTTYTFQFNGSIADINETNPLTDYRYIFTTGDIIDTLKHSGVVKNITTNELCNNCNVHLYKQLDDSLILKSKPDYLVKTNEAGKFSFTNLPNSTFNQIVLKDKNKNLLLDKEEFVSLSNTVTTTKTYTDTTYIFPTKNTDKLKAVFTKTRTPGYILFKMNKHVLTDNIQLLIDNETQVSTLTTQRDSIYTNYIPSKDSTDIQLIIDTDTFTSLYILPLKNLKHKPKITYNTTDTGFYITSNTLIKSINLQYITLSIDSILIPLGTPILKGKTAFFKTNLVDNQKLVLKPKAVIDVFDKTNRLDSTKLFKPKASTSLLTVSFNISNTNNYIIELKSDKKLVRRSVLIKTSTINYKNLTTGNYYIKIISDTNNNGIWDTGDLLSKKEPESIQFSTKFNIRENWDKELIINVL